MTATARGSFSTACYTLTLASGTLPSGLSFNSSTGVLSGTLASIAHDRDLGSATIKATDATDGKSVSVTFDLYLVGIGIGQMAGDGPLQATAAGHAMTESVPLTPNVQVDWFTYDADNRVVIENGSLENGHILITDALNSATNGYDAAGNKTMYTTVNASGQTLSQKNVYDVRGELTMVQTQSAPGGTYAVVETRGYDANGRLTSDVTYNLPGHTESGIDNNAVVTFSDAGWVASDIVYTYDDAGQLLDQSVYAEDSAQDLIDTYHTAAAIQGSSYATQDATAPATLPAVGANRDGALYLSSEQSYAASSGYGYDADGNVLGYQVITTGNLGQIARTDKYQNSYVWQNGALNAATTATTSSATYQPATHTNTYNALGELTKSSGRDDQGATQSAAMAYTADGEILRKDTGGSGGISQFLYAQGQGLGSMSTGGGINLLNTTGGYSNSELGTQNYVVQAGDTLAMVAMRVYGDASYGYLIADANGLANDAPLMLGTTLKLPQITTSTNTSSTFMPYRQGSIVSPGAAACVTTAQLVTTAIAAMLNQQALAGKFAQKFGNNGKGLLVGSSGFDDLQSARPYHAPSLFDMGSAGTISGYNAGIFDDLEGFGLPATGFGGYENLFGPGGAIDQIFDNYGDGGNSTNYLKEHPDGQNSGSSGLASYLLVSNPDSGFLQGPVDNGNSVVQTFPLSENGTNVAGDAGVFMPIDNFQAYMDAYQPDPLTSLADVDNSGQWVRVNYTDAALPAYTSDPYNKDNQDEQLKAIQYYDSMGINAQEQYLEGGPEPMDLNSIDALKSSYLTAAQSVGKDGYINALNDAIKAANTAIDANQWSAYLWVPANVLVPSSSPDNVAYPGSGIVTGPATDHWDGGMVMPDHLNLDIPAVPQFVSPPMGPIAISDSIDVAGSEQPPSLLSQAGSLLGQANGQIERFNGIVNDDLADEGFDALRRGDHAAYVYAGVKYAFYNTFMPHSVQEGAFDAVGGKIIGKGLGLVAREAVPIAMALGRKSGELYSSAGSALGDVWKSASRAFKGRGVPLVEREVVANSAGDIANSAARGAVVDANFAQPLIRADRTFSEIGQQTYSRLSGAPIKTVDDLAAALQRGEISPSQVPLDFVDLDGARLILNTRTSTALRDAGIPKADWFGINRTGQIADLETGTLFDDLARAQLQRNVRYSVPGQTGWPELLVPRGKR